MKPGSLLTRRSVLSGLAAASLSSPVFAQPVPLRPFARGARVPEGLKNRIKAQNASARSVTETLTTDFNFLKTLDAAHPLLAGQPTSLPAQFQVPITAVKSQGYCGSCWAFAAVAAYEASHLKVNKKKVDVSEQEALDCTFFDANCVAGGWHESVLMYLALYGLIGSDRYPYRETKLNCVDNMSREFFAMNWDYVQGAVSNSFIPPDAALKQAIYRYGALASAVLTHSDDPNFKSWDRYMKRYSPGQPNPNWSTDYPNGVFGGTPSKDLKGGDVDRIDHEVLIFGWDDTLGDHGCWLIKNSWGIDWGDEGIMKLPYGCNNIGFAASWVLARPAEGLDAPLIAKLKGLDQLNELKAFYPPMK